MLNRTPDKDLLLADSGDAQPQQDIQQHDQFDETARLPWESKRPWEMLGMSKATWYRQGRPTEKPLPDTPSAAGQSVIPDHLRRQPPARRTKPFRHTTPE